jgi:phage-related protein
MIYKLTGAALKIIVAIGKGLIAAIPEIIKSVPQIIGALVKAFGDFMKPVVDIGKNIVDGIKKGIENAWKNLKKWFTGLFDDIISVAKRILGIASPSKVFKKIGGFTAEGFGVGFEDEFAKVKGDMENAMAFDDFSVGINSSIRRAGAGTAYGGTSIGNVNITVNGANYTNEQSLASAIALEIQNMTDRRAAVYA